MELGHRVAKVSPVLMIHCIFFSVTVVINFKLFNFSTMPPSILGCFAPSIIIGALIISSALPTHLLVIGIMHVYHAMIPYVDLFGGGGVGGGRGGLASTTQGGIDAPAGHFSHPVEC